MKRLQHLFLFLLLSFTSRAAGIKIIESSGSLQNAVHWNTVVTAMGHVGLIVPASELNDINNFSTADAIIVSDGITHYSAIQMATLKVLLLLGKPVYLQTEFDKSFSANQAFAQFVNSMGGSFTWGRTVGVNSSITIHGSFATTDNVVTSLSYFLYGCTGSGSGGIFPFIKGESGEMGWSFCPANPGHGKLITTTDQDWAGDGYGDQSILLMRNIIKHLLTPDLCGSTGISGNIVTQTNISCKGGTDGSVTVTGAEGIAPYSYSWQPSGSTSATLTNLAAGVYTCTITDALFQTTTVTVTITEPAAALSATASQTSVSCNGGSNGTATVVTSGGTAPYTYLWSPSGGTGATALGLTAGTYMATIRDANGCITTKSITVTEPAAPVSAIASQTNVSCYRGSNGTATVVASGGTAPYTYLWSPSGGTGATASGLAVGNYTVTITDNNGCFTTKNFTITQPPALLAVPSQTGVSCNESLDGSASVTVSGGTVPYTYLWTPSGGTGATASGLAAGNYTVTATDANGCMITKNFTITAPAAAIQFNTSVLTDADYQLGYNTSVAATGGVGSLSYAVISGSLPQGISLTPVSGILSGTPAGTGDFTFTVKATDANGCSATKPYTLSVKKATAIITVNAQTKTYGNADPALTYTVTGLLNGDVLTGSLDRAAGENAGVYAILQNTLTAGNNYDVTYTGNNLTINKRAITIAASAQTKTYGDTDPDLTYTVTGLVNGDVLAGSLNRDPGENAGTYPVNQHTLAAGNNYDITYTGNALTITKAVLTARADDKAICLGSNLPVFTIQYSGFKNGDNVSAIATVPVVNITNPSTAGTYPLLPAGGAANNYQFNYVSGLFTVHASPSTPVIAVLDNKTELCEGEQATLTASATNANSYSWSTGASGSSITVGIAGNYTVTAKSAQGCVSQTSPAVAITVHPLPAGSITQTASGPGVIPGYILAAPAGASYSWNTGETTASITARSSGSYRVTVTNQQGCSNEFSAQVAFSTTSIPNTFSPNGDGINDYWVIPELKNYSPVYVTVVNRDGQTVFESKNFSRWDGRYKGNELPAGVYFYRVRAGGNKTMEGWLNLVR